MAKPELGTKRQCLSCGAKFYDLNRDPIACPKCGALFQVSSARAVPPPADDVDDDEAVLEPGAVDLVSLDDVAAQEDTPESTGDDDDDIDIGESLPDDEEPFLTDDDEENDDVSDLIDGDIGTDDEN
ncbi:TIGR02300 family protein [Pseudochelatococcus lubricantis]|uniref:TIGR02300 family protein n=1 Tax=Pseudochelatococcus lubricantis TaxID=1538102 RepID=UPI001423C729